MVVLNNAIQNVLQMYFSSVRQTTAVPRAHGLLVNVARTVVLFPTFPFHIPLLETEIFYGMNWDSWQLEFSYSEYRVWLNCLNLMEFQVSDDQVSMRHGFWKYFNVKLAQIHCIESVVRDEYTIEKRN